MADEPLLRPNPRRFVIFPLANEEVWRQYKIIEGAFCTDEVAEIADTNQPFLERLLVLSALLGEDGFMLKALSTEVQLPEARCAFGIIEAQTDINRETFGRLLEPFKTSDDVIESISGYTTEKIDWVRDAFKHAPFATRLVLLGIHCSIFSAGVTAMLARGSPPGAMTMNTRAAVFRKRVLKFIGVLFRFVKIKLEILGLVQKAVQLELGFMANINTSANSEEYTRFVRWTADDLLGSLNQDPVYRETNPFSELYETEELVTPERFQKLAHTLSSTDRSLSFDESF